MNVCGDVLTVVQNHKRVAHNRAVDRDGHGSQQNAESGIQAFTCEEWFASRKSFRIRLLWTSHACWGGSLATAHLLP